LVLPFKDYWDLLASYVRPERRRFALLSALLLGRIGLQLANPQIMRTFIDVATQSSPLVVDQGEMSRLLFRSGLLYLLVAVVLQAVTVAVAYVGKDLGWRTTNALRADLAQHCLRLDMSFHNARTPGEMIERVDGDVNSLSNFFSQFVVQVLGNVVLLLGVLGLLYEADWRAGLAMTAFSGITLAIVGWLQGFGSELWEEHRQARADMYGFLEERLAGTEDIRSCGATAYVMRRFYQLLRVAHRKLIRAGTLGAGITVNTADVLFGLGSVTALAIGATLFRREETTVGTVYLILHYTTMLMRPIREVTRQMHDLQQAGAGVTRVRELFSVESKVVDRPAATPGAPRLPKGALAVSFQDVSFGYEPEVRASQSNDGSPAQDSTADDRSAGELAGEPADQPAGEMPAKERVLHNLSLALAPGTVLGLLGRTGSGKTTLCRLLFRLYDPDEGVICFDCASSGAPVDLRALPLPELRRHVGVVTQDIQLFQASVRDNLTLFDTSIPDKRIERAIHDLGMGEWLASLPEGLDTELASGGGGLSAGEAQLLALTRIFLQDPGLVILDEASSRLDPATEAMIEHAVDALIRDRTAIVIAHRLSTVQRANEILILEEGRICEHGLRAELARDPTSRFYSLLQTGLEEVLV
jgi:ATP-binding cassette subfamily B protein